MSESLPSRKIDLAQLDAEALKQWIKSQALDLGFADCVVAKPDAQAEMVRFQEYLDRGYHADMDYLKENLEKRADPTLLVPGTKSIICVRMNYLVETPKPRYVPYEPNSAIIARYARGRDYHKIMRGRLKTLASRIRDKVGNFESRPFADSAPIFEKSLAESAGMGWTGKHTLLIHKKSGSFFVLGELFTSLDLPFDEPATAHCGSCSACIDICPTQAIVEPYMLDARKCIAYLTIEYKGIIPQELRHSIGNRVFGCDDCQLICPWNSFAKKATIEDFNPRNGLDNISLLELWQWDEEIFLKNTEGSPLRRTGYQSFKRNIAIGLGNAPYTTEIIAQLEQARTKHDEIVNHHIDWAIEQQISKS
ncbi:tRNA epoxyqueuosine(34) reductase QueG [Acinetobacter radioresistens]|uniref:tRNA epoxyqueuosine(34) reductase QueG n=1 Tax=Acinetobacter TaxID=469 RepID=UPI00047964AC|nr:MULTISPECIES: tRNA epoxyqueuosine(34) reductase QueG [Acinetobacter]MCU4516499.1 tRNA epoxyqueuosine(34) reductase QueG [Acinetobacter radioresistens]PKD83436.1 tRNA epoxyqueuosine(34) reductase QueG [Acinetobacter radioresistens]RSO68705.1 tRNA epoxyqueuosine(34) reductase QueG [Acinetobacter radioresistens]